MAMQLFRMLPPHEWRIKAKRWNALSFDSTNVGTRIRSVEPRERPEPEADDERRRYYRITPFGKAVAAQKHDG